MARINIEDEWFSDPRRFRLVELLGQGEAFADGTMIFLWKFAQKYWFKKELIPIHAWEGSGFSEHIITCGLAEKTEEGIYVRGSHEHFSWYQEKVEAGRIGGKKSAMRERDSKGRLLSKNNPEKPTKECNLGQKTDSYSFLSPCVEEKHEDFSKNCPSRLQADSKQIPSESNPLPLPLPLPQIRREEKKSSDKSANDLLASEIKDLWNKAAKQADLTEIKFLNDKRKKKVLDAIKEVPTIQDWKYIITQVGVDDFRMGINDRGWKASFDWLFQEKKGSGSKNYQLMLEEYESQNREAQ